MSVWKNVGLRALPLIVAYLIVLILIQVGVVNDYYFAIIVTIFRTRRSASVDEPSLLRY